MDTIKLANHIRIEALKMVNRSGASHIAGALSIADIIAVLFSDIMKVDLNSVSDPESDLFVLSKGHCGVAVYAALAELNVLQKSDLLTYYQNGSRLSGHISHKEVPGICFSTGSLGHGACAACGMAKAARLNKSKKRIYTIIGDGECDEGSIWEMALFANHHQLDNFKVIVDHNKMQSMDFCENTLTLLNLADKWAAFGWTVIEIDGHDHAQIKKALQHQSESKPTAIIAHTIKGKGVSFMENNILWHYRDPQGEFFTNALAELGANDEK